MQNKGAVPRTLAITLGDRRMGGKDCSTLGIISQRCSNPRLPDPGYPLSSDRGSSSEAGLSNQLLHRANHSPNAKHGEAITLLVGRSNAKSVRYGGVEFPHHPDPPYKCAAHEKPFKKKKKVLFWEDQGSPIPQHHISDGSVPPRRGRAVVRYCTYSQAAR